MNEVEFANKQAELLEDIDPIFHSTLSYMAYEREHSAGYEEIIGCLMGLVDDLTKPLKLAKEKWQNEVLESLLCEKNNK